MRRVKIGLYDVDIEKGLLRRVASDLVTKRFCEKYIVITDSKAGRIWSATLVSALKREGIFLGKITVPSGEESKTLQNVQEIAEEMLKLGANRGDGIIAFGGGMIGDLAGFIAASFMRGIAYVHVPTTLLAMIDSGVGGKTGVDLPSGKNMLGAFWNPKKVYIDPEVLASLPQKQWKSGLGEALKYGAIRDRFLWDFFEKHVNVLKKEPKTFLPSDWMIVEEMIERSVAIKADVVIKDEMERDLRQILNYGHTFGHVMETMSGYKAAHGEAVATGMRLASAVALKLRFMSIAEYQKQNGLIHELGLGKLKTKGLIRDFVKLMKNDKKSKGKLTLILVDRLGRCHQHLGKYPIAVDEKVVTEVLRESRLIDDRELTPVPAPASYSSPGSYQSYSAYPPYSAPQVSGSFPNSLNLDQTETSLQRRLRQMRERRIHAQQTGGKWLPG